MTSLAGGRPRVVFAQFGHGRMGKVHARNVAHHPRARLKYLVDPLADPLQAAEEYGAEVVDENRVFADPEVAAIIVASPSKTHAALVERAAHSGKAIFCEKPIDVDATRVRAVLRTVAQMGVKLFLTFNRRFDPSFRALHDRLRADEIGKPQIVLLTSRDPYPPPIEIIKISGGLFRDMMIHDFDVARWLLDEEPVELYAAGSCLNDPRVAEYGSLDTAVVTLRTATGAICVINNANNATYGYDQRVEVHGERGMLQISNRLPDSVVSSNGDGVAHTPPRHFYIERYADAYRIELDEFIAMLLDGKTLSPTGEDGLRALVLADCANESHLTRRPVAVPQS